MTIHRNIIFQAVAALCIILSGCSGSQANNAPAAKSQSAKSQDIPAFSSDSAYAFIQAQVDMGPRVPGSDAAKECADWIASELRRHGADTVIVQYTTLPDPMNPSREVPVRNILGRFNPDAKTHVMLAAHYDTRPVADEETDPSRSSRPIPGANDGASGVGVMLEVARMIGRQAPTTGVDLLFVDLEDSGTTGDDDSWCRGSQYFADNMPYTSATDRPMAAIVLDMVGAPGARFHREGFSDYAARPLVDRVWASARAAGHADRFPDAEGSPILDDHLPLLRAGIPAIDIVESRSDATGGFPAAWHTLADDMTNIDPATLKAVGETVAHFIYNYR